MATYMQTTQTTTRTEVHIPDPSPSTRLQHIQEGLSVSKDDIAVILAKHDRGETLSVQERQALKEFQETAPQYQRELQQVTHELSTHLKKELRMKQRICKVFKTESKPFLPKVFYPK